MRQSTRFLSTCLIGHVKASVVSRGPWLSHPASLRGKTARLGTFCLLVARTPGITLAVGFHYDPSVCFVGTISIGILLADQTQDDDGSANLTSAL